MSGSPRQALFDAYYSTELDAIRIQYGAELESTAKEAEARMAAATGSAQAAAYRTGAFTNILSGVSTMSQLKQQEDLFALQRQYYTQMREK